MVFIGISGKREAGKSLLGGYLEHNHGFTRFSLADNLKKRAMQDFGLTFPQLWGREKESRTEYIRTDGSNYTPRDILIRMGSFYRSIDKLFWCKQFDPNIAQKFVCDDIRFINEMSYFKARYDAKFVRLNRTDEAIGKAALDDLSETELNGYQHWDFELAAERNLTPNDLEKFASVIAHSIS